MNIKFEVQLTVIAWILCSTFYFICNQASSLVKAEIWKTLGMVGLLSRDLFTIWAQTFPTLRQTQIENYGEEIDIVGDPNFREKL